MASSGDQPKDESEEPAQTEFPSNELETPAKPLGSTEGRKPKSVGKPKNKPAIKAPNPASSGGFLGFWRGLIDVLPKLKTGIQLVGFVALVGGFVAYRSVPQDQVPGVIAAGAIGILLLIFGQFFRLIEGKERLQSTKLISIIFIAFCTFILLLFTVAVYFIRPQPSQINSPIVVTPVDGLLNAILEAETELNDFDIQSENTHVMYTNLFDPKNRLSMIKRLELGKNILDIVSKNDSMITSENAKNLDEAREFVDFIFVTLKRVEVKSPNFLDKMSKEEFRMPDDPEAKKIIHESLEQYAKSHGLKPLNPTDIDDGFRVSATMVDALLSCKQVQTMADDARKQWVQISDSSKKLIESSKRFLSARGDLRQLKEAYEKVVIDFNPMTKSNDQPPSLKIKLRNMYNECLKYNNQIKH